MKRIIYLITIGLPIFIFVSSSTGFGMSCGSMPSAQKECDTAAQHAKSTSEAIEVGNKICPVSGEEIDEATKVTYEHEGKVYNFCCAGCIDEFKKDPAKYIEKVNAELEVAKSAHSH